MKTFCSVVCAFLFAGVLQAKAEGDNLRFSNVLPDESNPYGGYREGFTRGVLAPHERNILTENGPEVEKGIYKFVLRKYWTEPKRTLLLETKTAWSSKNDQWIGDVSMKVVKAVKWSLENTASYHVVVRDLKEGKVIEPPVVLAPGEYQFTITATKKAEE